MTATLDEGTLGRLAGATPSSPVLSVYMRTDPRDPSNTRAAWRSELTTGLGAVSERLEGGDDRDARLAFRDLRERLLSDVRSLDAASTGRSLAWFLALDGSLDERFELRLPVRSSLVRLDDRPFVSPLVDVIERGAPTGVVLLDAERVRVLGWAHGVVDEADDVELDIDRSEWRRYDGAAGSPRHATSVTHTENVASREDEHRERFLRESAGSVGERIVASGWDRVVLVGAGDLAARFHLELPAPAREKVRLDMGLNIATLPSAEVAARIEPHLDALHHDAALAAADELGGAAPGLAAVGPPAVLAALAERRVETLVVDPLHVPDASSLPELASGVVAGAEAEYLPERAVEAAVASDAHVAALAVAESSALAQADGMLAGLRW